jgi:hypothetical protein
MKDEIAFYSSAFAATVATYPLDVIKTHQQLNKNAFGEIYRKYGIYGFFRGMGWQIASLPTFWLIFFTSREKLKPYPQKYLSPQWANACNIYVASMIASTAASPIFVTKTFHQVGGGSIHKRIMQNNGILGYFKGTPSTFLINTKLVPQFLIYDTLTQTYEMPVVAASIASKSMSALITYPFEVSRTHARINNTSIRQTFIDMIKKEKNPLGLYRGYWSYSLLSTLNFTIMMYLQSCFRASP